MRCTFRRGRSTLDTSSEDCDPGRPEGSGWFRREEVVRVIEINTQYVGVFASTLAHVPTIPLSAGVINADRRRQVTGDVRLLPPTPSVQGSALSTAIQVGNTGGMGFTR